MLDLAGGLLRELNMDIIDGKLWSLISYCFVKISKFNKQYIIFGKSQTPEIEAKIVSHFKVDMKKLAQNYFKIHSPKARDMLKNICYSKTIKVNIQVVAPLWVT